MTEELKEIKNNKIMKSKIELKEINGTIFYEYEAKDNTIKKTVEAYIRREKENGTEKYKLINADLSHADLNGIDLRYTDLRGTNLKGSNLIGADLRETDLSNADLSNALLMGANLMYADLKDTKLRNADLEDAILNSTKNIKYATCSFAGHGERGRQLIAIKINDEIMLFCGCFKGNEAELRKYIKEGDKKHKKSRLIALDTVLKLIEI